MLDADDRAELASLAEAQGVEPAALMAVVEVESGGRIFAEVHGRREPLIRFEGHYFYRLLGARKRNRAVVAGLADRGAGRVRNPRGQAGRWELLKRASAIDRPAALQSTSWGVGQVMGAHWQWLGYASVDALVARAREGLSGQAEILLRFIDKAQLREALTAHDWRAFARGYNGPDHARHGYDRRLAEAYDAYLALAGDKTKAVSGRHLALTLRPGDHGRLVAGLQRRLRAHGFMLAADGDFGPVTRAVLMRFQSGQGLAVDGIAGPGTFVALERPVPIAPPAKPVG
ncbi:MAG: DUF3380 domain-containing protein [Nitratireductor sp.]|nr:DUF3380 domain-containing protein [Nitratireductor sp.]